MFKTRAVAIACGAAFQLSAAAAADRPADAYRSTVVCAATMVALQQNPHPDAYGSLPDPQKLTLLANHMREAAFASGSKIGRSQAQVNEDIGHQAGAYTAQFHGAKNADQLHEVQTRLGRSVLGCAFVGQ